VKLVAEAGAAPVFEGDSPDAPAIRVLGGAGSMVYGVLVASAVGVGVQVEGDGVELREVTIKGSHRGLILYCAGTGCLGQVLLHNLDLIKNDIGMWASHLTIKMEGGQVHQSGVLGSLTSGLGVTLVNGARLEMVGTHVTENQYGLVMDGANTSAKLTDVQVMSNTERGVWLQHLRGTAAAPSVQIDGSTLIQGNAHTGVGAVDSTGIVIRGATISGTLARPAMTSLGTTADVGDGIGLFSNTADVTVEDARLEGNERCQVLVDQGGENIQIVRGTIKAAAGQAMVVVQNTTASVGVNPAAKSTGAAEMPVSAPDVTLPTLGQ